MRESNFSFPVQNRAAVVITSQLYDRRALDSSSPLPLFNSLTHLTYLTSTSPRIREILTIDGGLERLVRLLREFCSWPPPPQSPRMIYGLKPPVSSTIKRDSSAERDRKGKAKEDLPHSTTESGTKPSTSEPAPDPTQAIALDPNAPSPLHSFDRAAAFRFSLAFQCVVNIGVRGSENVRARVVQAGMLDVVSAVLECWLVSKGFAVCPSPTGSGIPRESKEVRIARRVELMERRQREASIVHAVQAAELARVLSGISAQQTPSRTGESATALNDSPTTSAAEAQLNDEMILMFTDGSAVNIGHSSTQPSRPAIEHSSSDPEGSNLSRNTTLRASSSYRSSSTVRPSTAPPIQRPETDSDPPSFPTSSTSSSFSFSNTIDPIPIRRPSTITSSTSSGNVSDAASVDTSANATPAGGNTPTGSLFVTARERSGTVIARPSRDRQNQSRRASGPASSNRRQSNPDTDEVETEPENHSESDAGGHSVSDVMVNRGGERPHPPQEHSTRMAVIVQSDPPDGSMDMNMIVDQGRGLVVGGDGMGVEQGLVNLDIQQNDDLAMGAPPGAPGAVQAVLPPNTPINPPGGATPRQTVDMTPRAGVQQLATINTFPSTSTPRQSTISTNRTPLVNNVTIPSSGGAHLPMVQPNAPSMGTTQLSISISAPSVSGANSGMMTVIEDQSAGPYREEDVLLSLQLLAYLSKYPHVRQAFYKPRIPLGPPLIAPTNRFTINPSSPTPAPTNPESASPSDQSPSPAKPTQYPSFMRKSAPVPRAPNVFALVERFTFRPSPSEVHLPRLPQEIQYWAGVIMRNACRKDEDRGGIRQCANMVCGKWESFPREFAKCRRCRKAKYCGKECQSKAWADGHRFWCSSRDAEIADAAAANGVPPNGSAPSSDNTAAAISDPGTGGGVIPDAVGIAQALAAGRRTGRHAHLGASHTSRHQHRNQQPPSQASSSTTASVDSAIAALSDANPQPPQAHNVIIRLGPPRAARIGTFAPAANRPGLPSTQPLPPNAPRQRITQHAIAPSSVNFDAATMEIDRWSPGRQGSVVLSDNPVPPQRRRAETLPATFHNVEPAQSAEGAHGLNYSILLPNTADLRTGLQSQEASQLQQARSQLQDEDIEMSIE